MKTDLVASRKANREQLLSALADLSEEQITTIPVVGEWTIQDIGGHITISILSPG